MHVDWQSIVALFLLAIPIACIARTVVYEEIFREPREYCQQRCKNCDHVLKRKFFYLFTCEFCFSHYVTLAVLFATRFTLLYDGWRGYGVAFFSLVFVANVYLAAYARLRVDITSEKASADEKQAQKQLAEMKIAEHRRRSVDVELPATREIA